MTTDERCELTELYVSACAHCIGVDPLYARPYQDASMPHWWVDDPFAD